MLAFENNSGNPQVTTTVGSENSSLSGIVVK